MLINLFAEEGAVGLEVLNQERLSRGLLGLHIAKVFYGNIGSRKLHSALGYLSPKQFEDQHTRQTVKSVA